MVYILIIFLFSLPLLHTYILFPIFVNYKFKKSISTPKNSVAISYPNVSIIMSVYNEEMVLSDKLNSISSSNYPNDKLNIFIGSDHSSDDSNELIANFSSPFPIFFYPFGKRRGKTRVINDLVKEALKITPHQNDHILIFTDANVLINEETIIELVQSFKDQEVELVDATMIPLGFENKGISRAEGTYINMESKLKYQEGIIWGMTIGPFGGCFALRSTAFKVIPPYLVVDDLFLALHVLTNKKKVITSPNAKCYEKVSSQVYEELKRKIRISSGNWQLLKQFPEIWFPPFNSALSFVFISHKLLRWLGPFFMMVIYVATFLWYRTDHPWGEKLFYGLNLFLIAPFILDQIFKLFQIPILIPRKVHYFLVMNFGLVLGFLKYLSGLNSNIWEPPKRK